ncbi:MULTISPECIES: arylsulfatase [Caballeronia]|jgi:arylsulfatase|uniref:Sulfatase n=1 Tax=Caballeronia zhejiangensis TaxID=871203 RepID=A0A656QT99_9BURK|nr:MULTISPECIES: arylsulfatase [Caballeronia]EKS71058.1 sulfatase [Burkholderia sp. SJ98]KDR34080.1 sulfatase [Caballeronia zhejiangensis]MDR5788284.1 arylsulfatase [Caballeronia sp. LP003]
MTLHRSIATRRAAVALAVASLFALASCGSSSDSSPTTAPVAAAKRPNILYIMADDLGYSDIHAFGGEINTPNLDALVASGRILTNHHTGTVCAITRAMLISGTDHHLVGEGTMGTPTDERKGLPGYEGYLNDRALSVAQLLKDGGYHTYMAGKWHIGSGIVGSTTGGGQTPDQWGFEHSYALLGGAATNHFAHEPAGSKNYTEDGQYVQPGQPGQPGGAGGSPSVFYSTDFYTQRLISYIDSNKGDGKPFFAYAAYTSPHWPLQVPEPYLHNYAGKYDAGYDVIRNARIARQKALGIIPADFNPYQGAPETLTSSPATANNGTANAKYISAVHNAAQGYSDYGPGTVNKSWNSLSAAEKKAQARYMEIYAGMVENLDHNIGLLIQHLKDIGEYDNTFILFQSDNGAEGWPIDSGADPTATDTANASDAVYSTLGTDNGQQNARRLQYGLRWAEVSATPFRLTKGYAGEGGVSTPLIAHLPGQTAQLPTLRAFTHVTDNTATFLAVAQITPPTQPAPASINTLTGVDSNKGKVVYNNRYVYPVTGQSLLPILKGDGTAEVHTAAFGDEAYGRGYLRSSDGRWKALWTEPPTGPADGHWQLFDLQADRGENNDVSAQNPSVIDSLVQQWNSYMSTVGGVEPLRPRGYY